MGFRVNPWESGFQVGARLFDISSTVDVVRIFMSLSSVSKSFPSVDYIAKKTIAPSGPPCSICASPPGLLA